MKNLSPAPTFMTLYAVPLSERLYAGKHISRQFDAVAARWAKVISLRSPLRENEDYRRALCQCLRACSFAVFSTKHKSFSDYLNKNNLYFQILAPEFSSYKETSVLITDKMDQLPFFLCSDQIVSKIILPFDKAKNCSFLPFGRGSRFFVDVKAGTVCRAENDLPKKLLDALSCPIGVSRRSLSEASALEYTIDQLNELPNAEDILSKLNLGRDEQRLKEQLVKRRSFYLQKMISA